MWSNVLIPFVGEAKMSYTYNVKFIFLRRVRALARASVGVCAPQRYLIRCNLLDLEEHGVGVLVRRSFSMVSTFQVRAMTCAVAVVLAFLRSAQLKLELNLSQAALVKRASPSTRDSRNSAIGTE